MIYQQTIIISKAKLKEVENILNTAHSDGGSYLVCNVIFPNKFQVDIQIKKTEKPWVEGVLFDLNGNQVEDCESKNDKKQILGEYCFNDGINEYFVFIERKDLYREYKFKKITRTNVIFNEIL
ncbi:hypothetical protein [Bacillus thuringiensis]|uniref:Uncharacterized protein n=1 Tax=Bacillus thuringiensis TaxID=1428 RepID=A0A9X6WGU7_BACTU|nr:hypothetical protein [Bacillus thuringiensis]PFJ29044.1 hypothetical protein COJ15_32795 [Bacillus thuringiensis]